MWLKRGVREVMCCWEGLGGGMSVMVGGCEMGVLGMRGNMGIWGCRKCGRC